MVHHQTAFYLAILCTAKVNKFDHASRVDHDVSTLDVTVNDVVAMEIGEGISDLLGVVCNSVAIQRTKPAYREIM